jgi:aminoglycoside phosphotransferase (APT) family kinase protein
MEKVNGQGLWGAMASAEPLREDLLLDQFGRLVARLHQLDWKPFTEHTTRYQVDPAAVLEDWFAPLRRSYREYHVEGFLNVIDWLDAHKSDITVQPAVVHLDFHANNVLIDPTDNDRMTVIDWSQLTVSDYRSDLAWTLMIMGDHGKPGWREKLLIAYSAASGHTIPNLEYFDVMCYLKLLASTVVSIKVGMEKLGMRPENEDTRKEQAIYLRQFADRLHNVTGLTIPEVEAALKQLTQA